MHWWWGYGWGMWWMMLWPVALLLLLLWALFARPTTNVRDETPELILKRRYARGDIDRDEYQRRLDDIRK